MLATVTKINLPSCLGFCSQICPIYLMAPYATCADLRYKTLNEVETVFPYNIYITEYINMLYY
jgi:hypothetical protein